MSAKDRQAYDAHIDTIMVQNDILDTARDEGREEGLAEGRAEGRAEGVAIVARNLISTGMDNDLICKVTGLSEQEINTIRGQCDPFSILKKSETMSKTETLLERRIRINRPFTEMETLQFVPSLVDGFIWGGVWYHFDTMHFEFRPEILWYPRLLQ